ncbi:acridine resistance protein [Enterobacteria phage T6]|uniref:Acridine resistance protein n=1 Tax=Enterobacteria phage T6 TaxID=10666 RepID=A0A346FJZ1_BPT6|nr:acridine resistance protein [Enterobacteria phage T6]
MNIAKLLGVISFICWIVACVLTICIDASSVFSQALAQGMWCIFNICVVI